MPNVQINNSQNRIELDDLVLDPIVTRVRKIFQSGDVSIEIEHARGSVRERFFDESPLE
jgi:hypothetical protein